MKLFCFLLTLVLVNVSAEDDPSTILKREIMLTNVSIEMAFKKNENEHNGLEHLITTMVDQRTMNAPPSINGINYSCFAKINYMIAMPLTTEICDHLPDLQINTPLIIKGAQYQHRMRQEIRYLLGIDDVPEVQTIQEKGINVQLVPDEHLILHRKRFVIPVLNKMMTSVLGKYADSNFVPQVVRDQNGAIVHDVTLYRLCRLTAIYMSITSPATYIRDVEVNPINQTCIFDDGTTKKLYNKFNNTWSKINSNNVPEQPIEDQIEALNLGSLSID